MKSIFTYYGGKAKLVSTIVPLIPPHKVYCEPFFGGGSIFFAKEPASLEIINDTNKELINFYQIVQNNIAALQKEIRATIHSRSIHEDALVIYYAPHLFTPVKRAWALWVLASQSFSSLIGGPWGYDKTTNLTTKSIEKRKASLTEVFAQRLEYTQIECTDALRVIATRDTKDTFFYIDPPYYNSDCRGYAGYTKQDFSDLLDTLSGIQGKFLLSSYSSPLLTQAIRSNHWHSFTKKMRIAAANHTNRTKMKIEVLTANYPIEK